MTLSDITLPPFNKHSVMYLLTSTSFTRKTCNCLWHPNMEFYDFSNHFPGIYYDAFNGIIQEYKSYDQMGQVMRKRVILYANNKGAHQPD